MNNRSTSNCGPSLEQAPERKCPILDYSGLRLFLLTARFASRPVPSERIAFWMTTRRKTFVAANCSEVLLRTLHPISRHLAPQKCDASTARSERWPRIPLVGVFLLATTFSSGQALAPMERFSDSDLHTPVLFARITQTVLPIFNSPLSLEQLRFPIYSGTTLPEIHPALEQPSRSSKLVQYRFTTAVPPLSSGNNWMGSFASNAARYGGTSHQKPPRPSPSTEQYVRHIPTAGPVVMRIYQEAKSHPRFTKVVSMFRPDP